MTTKRNAQDTVISVRMSHEQRERLHAVAVGAGRSLSEYVRSLVLDKTTPTPAVVVGTTPVTGSSWTQRPAWFLDVPGGYESSPGTLNIFPGHP
jgi:hypothetical protein